MTGLADAARHLGIPDGAFKLFLAGDVMTGRGVDQILPHPSEPRLYEPWVRSALTYVELAEKCNGPIARPVDFSYVWGDALRPLQRERPAVRIVNLETAVTSSNDAWPGKGIHYRMHPANATVLNSAAIDCCALANNHVLDWGHAGLRETLQTLHRHDVQTAGAGSDAAAAAAPAVFEVGLRRRVLVYAFGTDDSGVAQGFSATDTRAGVNRLPDLSARTVTAVAQSVHRARRIGDSVIASIHWGDNWGYAVPAAQRAFAHQLIDAGAADLVHGHSSHHAKGIEVYRGRLVLYGCGDFLNDYEGIGGHEEYRPELATMYFPTLGADGRLLDLTLVPLRMRRLRLETATRDEGAWLLAMFNRESAQFDSRFESAPQGRLVWTGGKRSGRVS
ncbi:MAG TPA: CapA family protein [Burkholderiaceae bacterium]|nr:CapA family protein [Burkholderiaceae bacterium]